MVKLKKSGVGLKQFVLFLTFILLTSCARQWQVSKIEGRQIPISDTQAGRPDVEAYIKPYRESIDRDMNKVLCYNPADLDKSHGKWQTAIGNVMADASLEKGNAVLAKRNLQPADFSMLNFGGIRSVIPKGNVTVRSAFEVMPFENSIFMVELKSEQVLELIRYFVSERKAHPLSGISFAIDGQSAKEITIQGKPFENGKTYRIITSDYLVQGGDRMDFFKKGVAYEDLDYKLRNVLIDYFSERDTLKADTQTRIRETR